jgi:hypothetical protein
MSVAHLLEALGIETVTPVPPETGPERTDKTQTKQQCSLHSLRSPEKHATTNTQQERKRPALRQRQQSLEPDALIIDIAYTLDVSPALLRNLLGSDDIQDIAEGIISRGHLLDYFRLMRSNGHPLAGDTPKPSKATEPSLGHIERMWAWKRPHDAMINHLMLCRRCHAPRNRYCPEGQKLRDDYHSAYEHTRESAGTP